MSAPKKVLRTVWGQTLLSYFDYTLPGNVCQELARYNRKALGQIFSTFLRSVQAAPGEVCFFGTQKYDHQSKVGLLGRIVMLLPIEYKPTSENILTLRDQGRQAVVGRGA